nr:hypothetical protein [Candidatus Sigynarchaeota archaeon]
MVQITIACNLCVGNIDACTANRALDNSIRPAIVHLDDTCGARDGPLDIVVPILDDPDDSAKLAGLMPAIT